MKAPGSPSSACKPPTLWSRHACNGAPLSAPWIAAPPRPPQGTAVDRSPPPARGELPEQLDGNCVVSPPARSAASSAPVIRPQFFNTTRRWRAKKGRWCKPLPRQGPGEGPPRPSIASNSQRRNQSRKLAQCNPSALTPAKSAPSGSTASNAPGCRVPATYAPDLYPPRPAQGQDTARCRGLPQFRRNRSPRQPPAPPPCEVQKRGTRGLGVLSSPQTPHGCPVRRATVLLLGHHPIDTTSGAAPQCPDIELSPGLLIIAALLLPSYPSSCLQSFHQATAPMTLQLASTDRAVVPAGA